MKKDSGGSGSRNGAHYKCLCVSSDRICKKGSGKLMQGCGIQKAKTRTYKDNGAWNFNGGVTYGLTDKAAAQFQYYGLNSDDTDGRSHELNLLLQCSSPGGFIYRV